MDIVGNIKALCEENNISIPKLEKTLGFGNGAIYTWKKGSPGIDKVKKVAEYFHVPVTKLIGDEMSELEEEFPEGVQVLRRATKELTPEAKAKMIKLMKAFLEEE